MKPDQKELLQLTKNNRRLEAGCLTLARELKEAREEVARLQAKEEDLDRRAEEYQAWLCELEGCELLTEKSLKPT